MPIDHTRTIYENIQTFDDWRVTGEKDSVFLTDEGRILLEGFKDNYTLVNSFNFGSGYELDDHPGSYSTLVRCVKKFEGHLKFYPPNPDGFNNTGELIIATVIPNGKLIEKRRTRFDAGDEFVKVENVELNKNFQYVFNQTSGINLRGSSIISSKNWEDYNNRISNKFLHTLSTSKERNILDLDNSNEGANEGNVQRLEKTGHDYEFVSVENGITWEEAREQASQRIYQSRRGYLATITSAEEQQFIEDLAGGTSSWIGASDKDKEGVWKWVEGPEGDEYNGEGIHFFTQYDSGGGESVDGRYENWNSGEPNDYSGGEDYGHIRSDGKWNDLPSNSELNGYIVEYGNRDILDPWEPILDGRSTKDLPGDFQGTVLQETVFPDGKEYNDLNAFRQMYNSPSISDYLQDSDIDADKEIGKSEDFDTEKQIKFTPEGYTILEDESKSECLLGFARTQYVNNDDYSSSSNNILKEYIKEYSSGNKVLILDDDLTYGYQLKSVVESILPEYDVLVAQSSMIMYDENVDYHNGMNSNSKKEVTKAEAFSLYSTESQSATSTENITKAKANPRVCPVLENGILTAGQTFKTTASFNSTEAELLYYRDEALKQTISTNDLQSRDILSVAFTEPVGYTLRPLIADGYGGDIAIIGDGGGSGVQPIETSVKTDVAYSQTSSDGIEPFRVNSISDVGFTTIAIADGDIETASVNTKQTPDNIINNFDCVLVQEFGNSDNAQEFLDRTPYSEPQKGTIYLDQWGSDSDSFSMLKDLRNNPSSINQSLDNNHLYGKVEKISDNAVKRGSDDPYKIFTIHSSETSDRITASGYSGDSLASVSSEIYVEEAYGFSKIDFIENQKTRVNEGVLNYGYIEDKRFFEVTGNNYITWEASSNDFVNVEIQTSTDNKNWSNATNGDSIPNVYKTREKAEGLYLRAKLTRDEGIDYTPSLDKLEFLIDEASAKVLDGTKLDALIPTQITAFEQSVQSTIFEVDPFTDTFPITYKESFVSNTLEAIVKEADITGIPLEATHNPSKWKIINNNGKETKLGEVVKSNRTFDTLTLEVVASESKMDNVIRPMYVNSGKENTNILSSGIQRSLDQTDNNNTYKLIPPYKSNPPFVPQKYTLKTYREKIDSNEGSRYNVKLVFKPKDPPEKDDKIFGDDLVRQERSPKQWLIEFRKGQIATRHIQTEIKSKSKYGVKLSRIQMIVSSHQSEAIVSNLIHNGATSVLKTDDGTSYILDSTHTKSNTITITPPGSGHEIESGEYVVDKWSIKSSGSDSTFIFRMYIAKS